MPLDLDRLAELARAATPGPWNDSWFYGGTQSESYCVLGPVQFQDPVCKTSRLEKGWRNAVYISAVSPDVILELIERVKVAEADAPPSSEGRA